MRNYSAAFSWQEKVDRLAQGEVAIDEFYKSVGPLRGHVVPVDEVGFFFWEFFLGVLEVGGSLYADTCCQSMRCV